MFCRTHVLQDSCFVDSRFVELMFCWIHVLPDSCYVGAKPRRRITWVFAIAGLDGRAIGSNSLSASVPAGRNSFGHHNELSIFVINLYFSWPGLEVIKALPSQIPVRYAPPFFDTAFMCRQDKTYEFKSV